MLKHTIEELGEFADTNADGIFQIYQLGHSERGRYSPADEPWACKVGQGDTHYAATPKDVVQKALDAHDAATNPDNQP